MSLSELIPALRSLSQAEKLNVMQFLLAEVSKSVSGSSTGEPELTLPSSSTVHPTLRRQGGVLVVETSPIDASALNSLIEQVREERTQKLLSL
jgi:hypothetical protein